MKTAVLSDTHNLLRPQVSALLKGCDAVIHAGDIGGRQLAEDIRAAVGKDVPVYFVRGNNDREWGEELPESLRFTLGGVSFFLVHKKKDVPEKLDGVQAVIYGHSHRYAQEEREGRLWLNPGSCGKRRFGLEITMAFLYMEEGKFRAERVDIGDMLSAQESGETESCRIPADGLLPSIEGILRGMDRGWRIERISRELKLDAGFVEEVCRIRVTHPGVSAEGILNKSEVNRMTGTEGK